VPRPRYHTALSLALAGLVVARTHRWRDALPVLVAGVLVDVDHLVDLLANRASKQPSWIILPLHAWEWVLVLLTRRTRMTDGLAGGLAAHLALDQTNRAVTHPLFYWIAIRARYAFRARRPLINPERWARGARWMSQSPYQWF
jgi:hypothetical protein